MDSHPQKAFNEIAISLSGGGYRAASFHLGTLHMLRTLDLLDRVSVLSTVSGGTITGVAWAVSMAEGKEFETFSDELQAFLKGSNVVQLSLEGLSGSSSINEFDAMPSLIRAASNVYADKKFLGNRQLALLKTKDRRTNKPIGQLKEIAFNATDFRTGNAFRFQRSRSPRVHTGNNLSRVAREVADKIRLADIVAASSCFPGGFEPLRFPSDFHWGSSAELKQARKDLGEKYPAEIALMDGGVFDNQGIDSVERIYERQGNAIDLYIISDTTQRAASLLEIERTPHSRWISVGFVAKLLWALMIGAFITVIALSVDAYQSYHSTGISWLRGIFLYAIPLFLSTIVAIGFFVGRRIIGNLLREFDAETGIDVWNNFRRVSIFAAIEILRSRVKSLLAMSKSVFMKRIRDLGFRRIFVNPDFEERAIANLIYDLDNSKRWGPHITGKKAAVRAGHEDELEEPEGEKTATDAEDEFAWRRPTPKLREISTDAEKYPTNLWFVDPADMKNLILCGEATMCFNMMRYLLSCRGQEIEDPSRPEHDLYNRTLAIWKEIKQEGEKYASNDGAD